MKYRCIKDTPWSSKEEIFPEHYEIEDIEFKCNDWPEYFEPVEDKSDEQKLKEFMYNVKVPNDLNTFLAVAKALLDKGLIDRSKL